MKAVIERSRRLMQGDSLTKEDKEDKNSNGNGRTLPPNAKGADKEKLSSPTKSAPRRKLHFGEEDEEDDIWL
jgi:hypothetical protein